MHLIYGKIHTKIVSIKLKEALISAPILRYPDYNKQFIIRTDACKLGLGDNLLQKDEKDGKEHPIHFISRTLNKAELNYSIRSCSLRLCKGI